MPDVKLALPSLGVDFLSDDTKLPSGAVRRAENVDLSNTGVFRRRPGSSLAVAGVGYHSLFTYGRGTLIGQGANVLFIDPTTYNAMQLCAMGVEAPVDFTEYNEHLYWTNSGSTWWLPSDAMTARRVGAALPSLLPDIVADTAGALLPGTYAVALARLDDRGEESPAKLLGTVLLPTGGGVRLTSIALESGASYRVYLSTADGEELYGAADFPAAFTEYLVGDTPDGAQRMTQHLAPMPAGSFIRGHAGRLYVAAGDTLWFSRPLRPHLHDPRSDFIRFAGQIKFIEPTPGGLYVGDQRGVWFLSGNDPLNAKQKLASPHVAVRRSSIRVEGAHLPEKVAPDDEHVALWLSECGYMVGKSDGSVIALNADRVRIAPGLEGKSVAVVRNGTRQIVTLVAASSYRTQGNSFNPAIEGTP